MKEVASQVERKIETEIPKNIALRPERFLACISSNYENAQMIIRKTARLAAYYRSKWFVLYVQTRNENPDQISLASQRYLINNFKTATELGADIIRVKNENVSKTIADTAAEKEITTICIGKPHFNWWRLILQKNFFNQLMNKISSSDIDLIILS